MPSPIKYATAEPAWPPNNAKEALLSSPSGRKMYEHMQAQSSPSKRTAATPNMGHKARRLLDDEKLSGGEDEDGEDDEETLQLKLQMMEAKLKLKKLQAKKKGLRQDSEADEDRETAQKEPGARLSKGKRTFFQFTEARQPSEAAGQRDVQVPVSPNKRQQTVITEQRSPGRVLLGIDKGVKGKDISLRRVPKSTSAYEDPFSDKHSMSSTTSHDRLLSAGARAPSAQSIGRSKTFSEKIAESRASEKDKKERAEALLRQRTKSFGIGKAELENFKDNAVVYSGHHRSKSSLKRELTREDIVKLSSGRGTPSLSTTERAEAAAKAQWHHLRPPSSASSRPPSSTETPSARHRSSPASSDNIASDDHRPTDDKGRSQFETSDFEANSSLHLSKRNIPHNDLTRLLSSRRITLIPELLATVKAPSWELPEDTVDFVVFGIIASKSTPKIHKNPPNKSTTANSERPKYMALTLTDLKWTLDLFLFDTGFTKWYKLTEGTLIAILNPTIMPPQQGKQDTGRFSLAISSSDDTILEIGTARDLGFCKAVKKDGKECMSWVDARHTAFCEFHVNAQLQRTKAGRMEVNTMATPYAPGGRGGSRTGMFSTRSHRSKNNTHGNGDQQQQPHSQGAAAMKKKDGSSYDRFTGTRFFVAPAAGPKNNRNFDYDPDTDPDAFHDRVSKEERLRRRLAETEHERDISRKLSAQQGSGRSTDIGREYLQSSSSSKAKTSKKNKTTADGSDDDDAEENQEGEEVTEAVENARLFMMEAARSAGQVKLSPVKKRRIGIGIGGGEVDGFDRGGSAAAGGGLSSPSKQTRFVTDKGIKVAGRESLPSGGRGLGRNGEDYDDDDDEDEDELDII